MSLRPFNSRNSVHVPSYESIQYCAPVKRWECPTLRETMDLVHQIVVQEGVTDLVHCWYRRVSVTGSPECCPPPRRATLYSLKPENTKWIKRRFNEYWNTYLSRWLQRRGRPGCRPNLILRCSILRKGVLEKQKHHLLRRKRRKQGFIVMQM